MIKIVQISFYRLFLTFFCFFPVPIEKLLNQVKTFDILATTNEVLYEPGSKFIVFLVLLSPWLVYYSTVVTRRAFNFVQFFSSAVHEVLSTNPSPNTRFVDFLDVTPWN
jgi:hypothetical protein